jgi:hypothetical protein
MEGCFSANKTVNQELVAGGKTMWIIDARWNTSNNKRFICVDWGWEVI